MITLLHVNFFGSVPFLSDKRGILLCGCTNNEEGDTFVIFTLSHNSFKSVILQLH